jgi:ABC-type lipoprotein release transport system permease subunit
VYRPGAPSPIWPRLTNASQATFLYRVEANDPGTLVLVAAVFVGVTILAAWIPARRAARTDPAIILRVQ